jgi:hypothetical protein
VPLLLTRATYGPLPPSVIVSTSVMSLCLCAQVVEVAMQQSHLFWVRHLDRLDFGGPPGFRKGVCRCVRACVCVLVWCVYACVRVCTCVCACVVCAP